MTEDQLRLLRVMADPAADPPGLPRRSRNEREAIQAALDWINWLDEKLDTLSHVALSVHGQPCPCRVCKEATSVRSQLPDVPMPEMPKWFSDLLARLTSEERRAIALKYLPPEIVDKAIADAPAIQD